MWSRNELSSLAEVPLYSSLPPGSVAIAHVITSWHSPFAPQDILNLDATRGLWVFDAHPMPLYPWKKIRGTRCTGGCVDPGVGLDLPIPGFEPRTGLACRDSLYRLLNPGPILQTNHPAIRPLPCGSPWILGTAATFCDTADRIVPAEWQRDERGSVHEMSADWTGWCVYMF
jgi:hypothetical protein